MKKTNIQKIWALGSICAILGSALVAFQNFVPHDPFRGHDTSDIYMNTALTDALKQADRERKASQDLKAQKDEGKTPSPELGRAPASANETQKK